jgi:uncharacterized protein YndB with AHSA1/START domain
MTGESQDTANANEGLTLVVRRTIAASASFLFDAWTQPQRLMQWWGPEGVTCPHAEIDLRPGGQLRIANRMPDGTTLWITGKFERIEPARLLVYSWQLAGNQAQHAEHFAVHAGAAERVTVRFEPRGAACEVIVSHQRIPDTTTRVQHEQGWIGCLRGLERHISLM